MFSGNSGNFKHCKNYNTERGIIYKEFARHLLFQTIMRIFAENLNGNKDKQIMIIEEIIRYNRQFVESKGYEKFLTSKYPDKKLAILSCMDTRLTELLPAALGIKNGDAKLIKNAGGLVISPFDSAMRSILVAIYELHVEEVMVIAHSNCGACHMNGREMKRAMVERGIRQDVIDTVAKCGIDLDHWLEGFHDTEDSVRNTVDVIKHHPLVPADINVHGYIIDSETGLLEEVK